MLRLLHEVGEKVGDLLPREWAQEKHWYQRGRLYKPWIPRPSEELS